MIYFIYLGGESTKQKWTNAYELARAGRLYEIDPAILVAHYSSLRSIMKDTMQLPDDLTPEKFKAYWYYGSSGTGKSKSAFQQYRNAYRKNAANKWWDGYCYQDCVIMDDLDVKHEYMVYHLKIWSDLYGFVAEIKGGAMSIRPSTLIVTSNYHPSQIWTNPGDLQPIMRRFKMVHYLYDDEPSHDFGYQEEEVRSPRPDARIPEPAQYAPGFVPHVIPGADEFII